MISIRAWFMAFRPKTLTAAVVPVMVGTALAFSSALSAKTDFHWWITLCALAGALFIQIGTNLVNDAADFVKGADTEERLGPKRVTQSGLLTHRQVMVMAALSFLLAMACGIPLVVQGGWVIVAIGLISIACGYAYTTGPFPLAYVGLGDLFVILFFGLVAVGGVFFLHSEGYSWPAVVAGLQVGFLGTVLIAINNLRDIDGDRQVKKKTLAVRFGKGFVRFEVLFLILTSYLFGLYWFFAGQIWAATLPLLSLPLAVVLTRALFRHEPGEIYNRFLAQSAALHVLFGLLLTLGLSL